MNGNERCSADVWCGRIRLSALAEAYHTKGATMEQLARAARTSVDAVSKQFKRYGIRTKWSGKRDLVSKRQILSAISYGKSQAQLAKSAGVSQSTISRRCDQLGIDWPEPQALTEDDIWWGIKQGMTQKELASHVDRKPHTISAACKKFGIDWTAEVERYRAVRKEAA